MGVDPAQRERIRDDLRGIVNGELLFDDLSCALYSTDASIFQIQPLGVAVPRDEEDVQVLVRYAAEHQLALIPRGAGTGLAGESLGSGIILDLSRHFRAVLDIGAASVRVQPGVVYQDLQKRLAARGRRFAPDPTSSVQCTIGGMLATNASGSRALLHGYTRDHVEQLRVVLDNGDGVSVGTEPRHDNSRTGRFQILCNQVIDLLDRHADLLPQCQPRTRFNRCGYLLHDVLTQDHLELAKMLIGSEGTLGVFTEATLRTIPLPASRSLVLLGFDGLDEALGASQDILASNPAACELIDRRLMT